MHIKLLLLGQLLALGCAQIWAHDAAVHDDEQSLDDVHVPDTTTTLPELEPENEATSHPVDGLQQLDEGLAIINQGSVLPETTTQTEKTTSPTTTTTTTTTTAATTTATTDLHKTHPTHPQAHPHPHPYPYPQPYPYPHQHGHPYPNAYAGPGFKDPAMPQSRETGPPGYPQPNFPVLRSPYGGYGLPAYHRGYPGFAPGLSYGHPSLSAEDSDEKPKSDEADDSAKDKSPESTEEAPKLPVGPPSFGYPPVYVIQRRPLPFYPYASAPRGYGSPYGYRR